MPVFQHWREEFVECAGYSFRIEDLRERAIRSDSPISFKKQVGITFVKEVMIQRTVFEIMSSMGWSKSSFELERPYQPKKYGNGKRADFAIKNPAAKRGNSWHYIEMKNYSTAAIRSDVDKIKIEGSKRRNSNHMVIYRTTTKPLESSGETNLLTMLKSKFPKEFHYSGAYLPIEHDFKTLVPKAFSKRYSEATGGRCEIVLVTIR